MTMIIAKSMRLIGETIRCRELTGEKKRNGKTKKKMGRANNR